MRMLLLGIDTQTTKQASHIFNTVYCLVYSVYKYKFELFFRFGKNHYIINKSDTNYQACGWIEFDFALELSLSLKLSYALARVLNVK